MAHMGIVITKESWAVLREEPLYSARFIDREGSAEIALAVRVEELDWFLEAHPPLSLTLTTWRSPQGTWVVALAYQLHPTCGEAKAGVFYLNPRQAADAQILRKLPQQESLYVIFLSADCSEHYTTGVVQPPQELTHWQQLIENMNQTLTRKQLAEDHDPDFEAARQDFQAGYSVQDLLAGLHRE